MSKKRNNPETIAIHGGDYRSDPTTNAVAVPISVNNFAIADSPNISSLNPTNNSINSEINSAIINFESS